jgi:hypothetical protein
MYSGAGLALVAGLLMGAAMKPNLGWDDRPVGPQIFTGWSGVRSTGPFDQDLAFAAYSTTIPDYVIGTDWAKLVAQPATFAYDLAEAAAEPDDSVFDVAAYEGRPTTVVYEEPAREPVSYPSVDGGRTYGQEPRYEMAAADTSQVATFDAEAPPEATGDTTIN